ncbi:hypothetical protein HJG60_008456 [Phyllostomus discolor]|uniref:Uncharacterized protein n=1 Tax=Phyllostomus discolor TaxID=89673 RepID=A0A834DN48_9CHIR|nr:hypothetical protein HJG60_008456 [Phyllostomus discolor]
MFISILHTSKLKSRKGSSSQGQGRGQSNCGRVFLTTGPAGISAASPACFLPSPENAGDAGHSGGAKAPTGPGVKKPPRCIMGRLEEPMPRETWSPAGTTRARCQGWDDRQDRTCPQTQGSCSHPLSSLPAPCSRWLLLEAALAPSARKTKS